LFSDHNEKLTVQMSTKMRQGKTELEEAIQEAMRESGGPLGFGRLNIVGEGRSGKTALVRALQGLEFQDTNSTSGVDQKLMEVRQSTIGVTGESEVWRQLEAGSNPSVSMERMTAISAASKLPSSQGDSHKRLSLHEEGSMEDLLVPDSNESLSVRDESETSVSIPETIPKSSTPRSASCATPTIALKKELVLQEMNDVGLRLSIWDFGGQEVFYALHHLYLTRFAAYAVIFNMQVRTTAYLWHEM
jgi:GTPase SAR1 family protein